MTRNETLMEVVHLASAALVADTDDVKRHALADIYDAIAPDGVLHVCWSELAYVPSLPKLKTASEDCRVYEYDERKDGE